MSSRFDRRDPGTDPDYCDGLEPREAEPLHDFETAAKRSLLVPIVQIALRGAELLASHDCPEALYDWLMEASGEAHQLLSFGYVGVDDDPRHLLASKLAAEQAIKQVT